MSGGDDNSTGQHQHEKNRHLYQSDGDGNQPFDVLVLCRFRFHSIVYTYSLPSQRYPLAMVSTVVAADNNTIACDAAAGVNEKDELVDSHQKKL